MLPSHNPLCLSYLVSYYYKIFLEGIFFLVYFKSNRTQIWHLGPLEAPRQMQWRWRRDRQIHIKLLLQGQFSCLFSFSCISSCSGCMWHLQGESKSGCGKMQPTKFHSKTSYIPCSVLAYDFCSTYFSLLPALHDNNTARQTFFYCCYFY